MGWYGSNIQKRFGSYLYFLWTYFEEKNDNINMWWLTRYWIQVHIHDIHVHIWMHVWSTYCSGVILMVYYIRTKCVHPKGSYYTGWGYEANLEILSRGTQTWPIIIKLSPAGGERPADNTRPQDPLPAVGFFPDIPRPGWRPLWPLTQRWGVQTDRLAPAKNSR